MQGPGLVGRDRELGAFEDALRSLHDGERAVVMLDGEPGIGKTRLLEELAARVIAQGGAVAWGRMWEVGMTPAFWPFIQVLGALEVESDRAPLLGSLESRADAATRLARFGEVAAFLSRRAAAAPIAILLDDLHAADPSSLQLLEYLLPLSLRTRVLWALAARNSDGTKDVAAALGRIARTARRLPLARLDRGQVSALVGDRNDGARVFELSEGNPLFVLELLASVQSGASLRLPALSSARAVIRERLATLPEASNAALVAASVVGREFRGQVIAQMLGLDELGARLQPALGLAMVAMTTPDRYRFSHALVAEAIADELDPSERARLHLRAAQAFERHEPSASGAIAHHLLAAGHLAAEAAVHAAERAAEQCNAQLAFEDAAVLLERALHALALAAPGDARRRAALLCSHAQALQHASRHALAAELCDEAASIARGLDLARDGNCELLARIALTRGLEFRFGRIDPLLVALLREALAALGDQAPSLRAKLLARLAAAEQPATDPSGPIARAHEAIELAASLEPRDRMDVMYVATSALIDYLDPEPLERIHLEVLALAHGTDRSISAHTRLRLCFTALDRIDRRGFDAAVHVFSAEASALGLPRWTRQVHMLEAITALLEGRFADAQSAASRSEAISSSLGDTSALWMLDVHRAMQAWLRTGPIDAAVLARAGDYAPARAAVAAWLNTIDDAIEPTRNALCEIDGHMPLDPELAVMVAAAAAFTGNKELATRAYDVLAPRSGRIVVATMVGAAVMDLYDRLLLVLATTTSRWDAIELHAQRALDIAGRLGSPPWTARVRADFAEALDRRGHAGDAQRARELWTQALADAERLDMPGMLARCRAACQPARRTDATPHTPAPAGPLRTQPIALTKSGELWLLRGFGEQVHVKDSRGMQLLARLIDEPGRELHVLDLAGSTAALDGGSGPLLDTRARDSYRGRLRDLTGQAEQAEADGDLGRAERARAEIDALSAEIERAFGLGGHERKAGAASERARSNIQRRIAHAIDQISAASPRLGEHLGASVRTGTYCVYAPTVERIAKQRA